MAETHSMQLVNHQSGACYSSSTVYGLTLEAAREYASTRTHEFREQAQNNEWKDIAHCCEFVIIDSPEWKKWKTNRYSHQKADN